MIETSRSNGLRVGDSFTKAATSMNSTVGPNEHFNEGMFQYPKDYSALNSRTAENVSKFLNCCVAVITVLNRVRNHRLAMFVLNIVTSNSILLGFSLN